jgi:hypothetical protein
MRPPETWEIRRRLAETRARLRAFDSRPQKGEPRWPPTTSSAYARTGLREPKRPTSMTRILVSWTEIASFESFTFVAAATVEAQAGACAMAYNELFSSLLRRAVRSGNR